MPSQDYFNKLFTLYAPAYPIISKLFSGSRKRIIGNLETKLQIKGKPKVLLIGAGDGVDIPYFNEHIDLTYLDASKGMYERAKRKFANRKQTQFVQSDFLSFQEPHSYDLVCLHFCLSVTSHPLQMIKKAITIIQSNGFLSIMDVSEPKNTIIGQVVNTLTKFSMFDLGLDVEQLISETSTNIALKEKQELMESNLFASFLYQIGSDEHYEK